MSVPAVLTAAPRAPRAPRSEVLKARLASFDTHANRIIHGTRHEKATSAAVLLSRWWMRYGVIAAVGAMGDAVYGKRQTAAMRGTLAATAAALATEGVKYLARRERPPTVDKAVEALVPLPRSYSFPSGHAASAFAAAAAAGYFHPRLRPLLWGLAGAVAYSRVYLGVHYLSDVVVGAAFGAGVGLATAEAARYLAERAEGELGPLVAE